MIKKIINWIKNLFRKEEQSPDELYKEVHDDLDKKLKVIYKSDWYKERKKNFYKRYEEFKEETKHLIGKIFEHDEIGFYKILNVQKPWFLKSPILTDSANFQWKFDEEFDVETFDYNECTEVDLPIIQESTEYSKEAGDKIIKQRFADFSEETN